MRNIYFKSNTNRYYTIDNVVKAIDIIYGEDLSSYDEDVTYNKILEMINDGRIFGLEPINISSDISSLDDLIKSFIRCGTDYFTLCKYFNTYNEDKLADKIKIIESTRSQSKVKNEMEM